MQYTLNLEINANDLKNIKAAGQNVILAKPAQSSGGASAPNVVWLAFSPFEGNQITWEETYGIYASNTQEFSDGTTIMKISETDFPAQDQAYYNFTSSAVFDGPHTGSGAPTKGSYQANNQMPNSQYPKLTFGLEQAAAINGNGITPHPVNAALVLSQETAIFTPYTTVYVWLQANIQSSTVLTVIKSNMAKVLFGGDVTEQTLKYDPAAGVFVPATASQLVEMLSPSGIY